MLPSTSVASSASSAALGSALAEQAAPELLQLEQPVPLSHIHTYVQAGASSIGLSSDNRPVLNLGLSFKLPINELFDAICRYQDRLEAEDREPELAPPSTSSASNTSTAANSDTAGAGSGAALPTGSGSSAAGAETGSSSGPGI